MVMSFEKTVQHPLRLERASKTDVRTQFAALCWRINKDKVQVCLVTSRTNHRWIIPKGWPIDGKTPAQCAEIEAWEEAGVKGKVDTRSLGLFSYIKPYDDTKLPCIALVFPLKVKSVSTKWPEGSERRRKWVSRKKAAKMVDDRELGNLILAFDPRS